MEMPKALETVLSALLDNHTVTSWKVAAEPGNNPAVVIRLRPKRDSQDSQNGEINTHVYRRKTASQVKRDKARLADFKNRLAVAYESEENSLSHADAGENPVISVDTCFPKKVTHKVCRGVSLMTETETGAGERTMEKTCHISAEANDFENVQSSSTPDHDCLQSAKYTETETFSTSTVSKHDSESSVTECKQIGPNTPSPLNTLPDPSRQTQQHGDDTRPPPPLPAAPSARDSRTHSDQMDTADGAEGGWGSEGGDTEGHWDTDTEWEDEQREIIIDKVKHSNCSTLTRHLIKDKTRNKSFQRVVIDKRGRGVPTLVCFTNDVILTMNIGTGEKDIHVVERQSTGTGRGDDLQRACTLWPDVARRGEYKDSIDDMERELPCIMDIVREVL